MTNEDPHPESPHQHADGWVIDPAGGAASELEELVARREQLTTAFHETIEPIVQSAIAYELQLVENRLAEISGTAAGSRADARQVAQHAVGQQPVDRGAGGRAHDTVVANGAHTTAHRNDHADTTAWPQPAPVTTQRQTDVATPTDRPAATPPPAPALGARPELFGHQPQPGPGPDGLPDAPAPEPTSLIQPAHPEDVSNGVHDAAHDAVSNGQVHPDQPAPPPSPGHVAGGGAGPGGSGADLWPGDSPPAAGPTRELWAVPTDPRHPAEPELSPTNDPALDPASGHAAGLDHHVTGDVPAAADHPAPAGHEANGAYPDPTGIGEADAPDAGTADWPPDEQPFGHEQFYPSAHDWPSVAEHEAAGELDDHDDLDDHDAHAGPVANGFAPALDRFDADPSSPDPGRGHPDDDTAGLGFDTADVPSGAGLAPGPHGVAPGPHGEAPAHGDDPDDGGDRHGHDRHEDPSIGHFATTTDDQWVGADLPPLPADELIDDLRQNGHVDHTGQLQHLGYTDHDDHDDHDTVDHGHGAAAPSVMGDYPPPAPHQAGHDDGSDLYDQVAVTGYVPQHDPAAGAHPGDRHHQPPHPWDGDEAFDRSAEQRADLDAASHGSRRSHPAPSHRTGGRPGAHQPPPGGDGAPPAGPADHETINERPDRRRPTGPPLVSQAAPSGAGGRNGATGRILAVVGLSLAALAAFLWFGNGDRSQGGHGGGERRRPGLDR